MHCHIEGGLLGMCQTRGLLGAKMAWPVMHPVNEATGKRTACVSSTVGFTAVLQSSLLLIPIEQYLWSGAVLIMGIALKVEIAIKCSFLYSLADHLAIHCTIQYCATLMMVYPQHRHVPAP